MTNKPWQKQPKRSIKEQALAYAKRGWFVFPSPPDGSKMGMVSAENSNLNRWGSTNNAAEVQAYYERWPNANVGIATGTNSGIFVLEADTPKGHDVDGIAELHKLEVQNGVLPATLQAVSPTGSLHYFFNYPADAEIYNSTGSIAPGVDIRGEGGMVLAAPSNRPNVGTYKWLNDKPIADAPDWLLKAAAKSVVTFFTGVADAEADIDELAQAMQVIPNNDDSWQAWNNMGMALYRASSGQGFALFDEWSHKWHGYNARNTQQRWAAYSKSPPTELGAGTVFWYADQADPHWRNGHATTERDELGATLTANLLKDKPADTTAVPQEYLLREIPAPILNVPGLVGDITQWIVDTAQYPQPGLALGAALVIVGTVAGRHIAGPTRSGTHLYVVGVGPSAAGKDHPMKQIHNILFNAGLAEHTGPSQFISMPAVVRFLMRKPLSVSCIDEMGAFLKRVNSKRASGFEGAISSVFRSLWGSSFDPYITPEWAATESQIIHSPAFSLYGISTVAEFYNSLEDADIQNGLLNRFLMIETRKRPAKQDPLKDKALVPAVITQALKAIYDSAPGTNELVSPLQLIESPMYRTIDWSPKAHTLWNDFAADMIKLSDSNSEVEPFVGRTAEIAIRLATIVTVGQRVDCIETDVMQWACDFARWSTDTLVQSAGLYIADSEHQAMANHIKRILARKQNGAAAGRVSRADLWRSLRYKYKQRDLDDALRSLAEGGTVRVEKSTPEKGGPVTLWYTLLPH